MLSLCYPNISKCLCETARERETETETETETGKEEKEKRGSPCRMGRGHLKRSYMRHPRPREPSCHCFRYIGGTHPRNAARAENAAASWSVSCCDQGTRFVGFAPGPRERYSAKVVFWQ